MGSFEERQVVAKQRERWLRVYREAPEVFGGFEIAEDPAGLGPARLAELAGLGGKRVLELGCGTGWLTRSLAPLAARYLALEPSRPMLAKALEASADGPGLAGAAPLRARGERLPLATGSIERVVASWMLLDLRPELRHAVVAEVERVLARRAPDDEAGFWLIENHGTGEYQALRDLVDERDGIGEVRPLIDELGFELRAVVETEYRFKTCAEATHVLGTILGDEVRAELERHPRRRIGLDLAILSR